MTAVAADHLKRSYLMINFIGGNSGIMDAWGPSPYDKDIMDVMFDIAPYIPVASLLPASVKMIAAILADSDEGDDKAAITAFKVSWAIRALIEGGCTALPVAAFDGFCFGCRILYLRKEGRRAIAAGNAFAAKPCLKVFKEIMEKRAIQA